MVSIEITSLIVSIGTLIPIIIFAIFVEKHYTKFWVGVWNLVTLIVIGLSILIIPIGNSVPNIHIDSYAIPLWVVPLPFAAISLVIGFKHHSNTIRQLGSSILTASVIVPLIIVQALSISEPVTMLILGGITYVTLYVTREITKHHHLLTH